jgi:galactoside O-acetyltransferase
MTIGNDVRISPKAEIIRTEFVRIGNHVAIDMGVYLSTKALIGDYVHIAPNVNIIGGAAGSLIMEDFTNIAAGSTIVIVGDSFIDGLLNPIVPIKYRKLIGEQVVMRRFSVIGVNSVVLPNVEMAEGSVLGANSLLTSSTEPWTVYVGSPARPIKSVRNKEFIINAARELGYSYE